MTEAEVEVTLPPTLFDFYESSAFVRLLVGPIGSGKSSVCSFELIRRAREQRPGPDGVRRSRFAVIRNSYPELRDTTRKTFEDWVKRVGLGGCVTWREVENTAVFERGDVRCEILFRALDRPDDIRKLLSLELTGAWINEAREVPRAVLDMLQGRVGRYPAKVDGGASWFGIWLDTNPPDADHWIYTLFEEQRPEGFQVFHQPSGRSPEAENLENLPPGYYQRLCLGHDEEWIKVYVDGLYGFVSDGRPVFPEFRDPVHVAPVTRLNVPVRIGMDFGLTPAAVLAQRAPDGQLQVMREFVTEDMGAVTFANELARILRSEYGSSQVVGWGDPAGEQRVQTDERTPFDVVAAAGLPVVPAPTNDFVRRREAVAGLLTRMTMSARPALVIDPSCTTLRKAMGGGYCYRRLQVGGEARFKDVPDKNRFSHVADALQYLCVGEGEDRTAIHGAAPRRVAVNFKVKRAFGSRR